MKTHFIIGCTLILLSISFKLSAQTDTTLKRIYEQQTIHFNGKSYVINNREIKIKDLYKEFDSCSPEAKEEMRLYRKYDKRAMIGNLGTAIFLTDIILLTTDTRLTMTTYWIVFTVGLIPSIIGIRNANKSYKHFSNAIWLHNRDVLLKK